MNIYKFISWFVSNVGGTIAIIMALWKVYKYFSTRIKSEVTFLFHPESSEEGMPTFFKISVTNLSNHPISILDIKLGNNEMEESKIINTSRDKAFITLKEYGNYSYPIFTDPLPITIPARHSSSLFLEALKCKEFAKLDTIVFQTENKKIKQPLSKKLMEEADIYHLR
ncbi:hypothetical protein [Melissococcus plutonius]|uniref:hypothetical protein n=1 Tax=Melissococcus plutonius TaxID=33970 RepID=UPI00065DDB98|nr:hypothetical protein [Melissococcus plutonius]AIM25780.1 hypothetical protein MEPL_c010450 [Melissococcus plutonius S1]KMT23476.1 hypothetical protein MEPL2_43p00580 [Melissococcus plutonius]KMT25234.1 hypothetical protein MEPL2_2c07920 [Melissococcus plutonius]KMT26140.1 hypothetical protein MEPL3_3c00650 [Melissococcus plutonius]KMT26870.1 hypothetical protein MEPL1_4c00650 [Melissococcus plutonius]